MEEEEEGMEEEEEEGMEEEEEEVATPLPEVTTPLDPAATATHLRVTLVVDLSLAEGAMIVPTGEEGEGPWGEVGGGGTEIEGVLAEERNSRTSRSLIQVSAFNTFHQLWLIKVTLTSLPH